MEKKEISNAFEALKMAKEIAHNEYVDIRAKIHNKWLAESDVEWRTKGLKLPYPSFPSYPSEQEILSRAKNILDFLNSDRVITTITKEETSNVLPLQSLDTIPLEVAQSSLSILPSMEPSIQRPLLPSPPRLSVGRTLEPILLEDKSKKVDDANTKSSSAGKIVTQIINKMTMR